jgi:hypothetical protein
LPDPQNVTVTELSTGARLVTCDLDTSSGWNVFRVRRTFGAQAAVVICNDAPSEDTLDRADHAAGGADPYNPALEVVNHVRDTESIAAGTYTYEAQLATVSAGVDSATSNWVAATPITITGTVTDFGGVPHPLQSRAFTSRVFAWYLAGGTLADSQAAIDQGGINFGTATVNFGGASGDYETFIANELQDSIDASITIAQVISRPFGIHTVAENTASDTAVDRYTIGRRTDGGVWVTGSMRSPLSAIELGIDGVVIDDFISAFSTLYTQEVPVVFHWGIAAQNETHDDDDAIDAILAIVLQAKAHLWLDAHLGIGLTDDLTAVDTITKKIVERCAELGINVGLEGQLLRTRSEHWFTSYTNVYPVIEFDLWFDTVNAGGDPADPLNVMDLIDSDPNTNYIQSDEYPGLPWFVIIDATTSAYVGAAVGADAQRDRAIAINKAARAFAPNVYTGIGAQTITRVMTAEHWEDLLAENNDPVALEMGLSYTLRLVDSYDFKLGVLP